MWTYIDLAVIENSHCHPILSEINPPEQLNKNISEILLIKTSLKYQNENMNVNKIGYQNLRPKVKTWVLKS